MPAAHELPSLARTWIEHWPAEVQALSFRQRGLALDPAQAAALRRAAGATGPIAASWTLDSTDDAAWASLEAALDALWVDFPAGAFVRLGSRSPKDTPLGLASGCHAASGAQALKLLCSGSRRVQHDLAWAARHGLLPYIWLRAWHDIPWSAEWRCFVQAGRLVGMGQYHTALALPCAELMRAQRAQPAVERLATTLARAMPLPNVVFDVWLREMDEAPLLIEINPWGLPTDAGLFDWGAGFDGSLRWRDRSHAPDLSEDIGPGLPWSREAG